MKRILATALLVLTTAPAMAERYENSSYTKPLVAFCESVGRSADYVAQKRDEGYYEQTLLKLLGDEPGRFWDDARMNVTMVYHMGGWLMSTPEQIAQGAYENCMAQHGPETWWRQPAVAGAP